MTTRYVRFHVLCAVILFLALVWSCDKKRNEFSCKDELGCVTLKPNEPFKIGVLQALSGNMAALGDDQVRGLRMALDDIGGKALGHAVELQVEDTGCSAEGGANAVLKIIVDPKVLAIFGTTCSSAAKTASSAMSRAGLSMISGNNSASYLTSVNHEKARYWQDGYFRVSNNEEHAGRAAALYAHGVLGVTRAAVIHDGDIYTLGLADGFIRTFSKLGGEIVQTAIIEKGEHQMGPVLASVEQSEAQLLFFPLFQPEGNHIVRQAKKRPKMKDVVLMSDGALMVQSFIDDVGDLGLGMYFVGPSQVTGLRANEMDKRYVDKYKGPSSTGYYMFAYDASRLLFDVIRKTAVVDDDGTLHFGRRALRQGFYNIKNVPGVTGSLSCDEFGDCSQPDFTVVRLDTPGDGVKGLQNNYMKRYVFESKITGDRAQ